VEAGKVFEKETGKTAQAAFVRVIPAGLEEGKEVNGIVLMAAEWVEPGKVAVTAGGMEIIDEEFRKWRKK
jgi:hypothetical protein